MNYATTSVTHVDIFDHQARGNTALQQYTVTIIGCMRCICTAANSAPSKCSS